MIHSRGMRHKRRGSVALETALVLPPLLILIIFFLSAMIHERRLLVLAAALDETAAEVSLVLPLSQVGSAALSNWGDSLSEDLDLELAPWLLQSGEVIVEWASDTAWEIIIDHRLNDKLEQSIFKRSAFDRIDNSPDQKLRAFRPRAIELSRDPSSPVIWIICKWNSRILWLPVQNVLKTPIPMWSVKLAEESAENPDRSKDDVWMLGNFERGQILRQQYGANMPGDFPVIARWSGGEATLIHSIDLTAPTYSSPAEIRSAVIKRLSDLSSFAGSHYQRSSEQIDITAEAIQSRRMILIIPANAYTAIPRQILTVLQNEARQMGIKMVIETYGESHRYTRN